MWQAGAGAGVLLTGVGCKNMTKGIDKLIPGVYNRGMINLTKGKNMADAEKLVEQVARYLRDNCDAEGGCPLVFEGWAQTYLEQLWGE